MLVRAIVIDDSRAVRLILRRLLAGLGFHEIVEAGDGQQALDMLAEIGPVDVALVDWNMPVLDGLGFVAALRADADHDGCRVVMVTTESDVDRVVQALEAGADEYAVKPFDSEVIAGKLALLGVVPEAGG